MANNHVHQQSQGERQRTNDEGRDELDRSHDDVDRPRNTRWEQCVLEELGRALLNTGVDEGHVRDQRQHQWHTDHRGAGHIQERDDAGDVHEQNHEEQGGQNRQEALAVFLTEQVFSDVDAHEVEAHFDEALETTGNDRHLASSEVEHQQQRNDRDPSGQDDAVELERRAFEDDCRREELANRGAVEGRSVSRGLEANEEVQGGSEQLSILCFGAWRRCLSRRRTQFL